MLSALFACDLGDERLVELEDALRRRWNSIIIDPYDRHLHAEFVDRVAFIDICTPDGGLLLCGGFAAEHTRCWGALGIFRLVAQGEKPAPTPLAQLTSQRESQLTCGRWLCGDSGLFVTGDVKGGISIWDTSAFTVVSKMKPGIHEDEILSLAMSSVPNSSTCLVAVAARRCRDVLLCDLGSGSTAHRLEGHCGNVWDVAWSTTNPYMLASAGYDGAVRIFDVRRSGKTACLMECVGSRPLPLSGQAMFEDAIWEKTGPSLKRKRTDDDGGKVSTMKRSNLLGLGCIWELGEATQRHRQKIRMRTNGTGAHRSYSRSDSYNRVRFSPDGFTVVASSAKHPKVVCWDVPTGRMLRSFRHAGRPSVFEMARDGYHMFSNEAGALRAHSIEDGALMWMRKSEENGFMRYRSTRMTDIAIHPIVEEVYSATVKDIFCWSPRDPRLDEEIRVNGERG